MNGLSVIHRIFENLNLETLKGTLVGVPVVNIPGFLMNQREFLDGKDINRVMPGKKIGTPSEQYAFSFVERILGQFDYLIDLHTASFGRINSRISAIGICGIALGCVIGGSLGAINYRLPFALAVLGYIALFVSALSLVEPKRSKLQVSESYAKELYKIAKDCLFHREVLRWLFAASAISVALLQIGFWAYQPYFIELGIQEQYFGVLFAVFNLIAAVGAQFGQYSEDLFGRRRCYALQLALLPLVYFVMAVWASAYAVLLILIHQYIRGAGRIVIANGLHEQLQSEVRATGISLSNMCDRLFYAALMLPAGWLSEAHGVQALFLALAVLGAAAGAGLLVAMPKAKKAWRPLAAVAS